MNVAEKIELQARARTLLDLLEASPSAIRADISPEVKEVLSELLKAIEGREL